MRGEEGRLLGLLQYEQKQYVCSHPQPEYQETTIDIPVSACHAAEAALATDLPSLVSPFCLARSYANPSRTLGLPKRKNNENPVPTRRTSKPVSTQLVCKLGSELFIEVEPRNCLRARCAANRPQKTCPARSARVPRKCTDRETLSV